MDLSDYADSCRAFCELLPPGRPRVLDAACGPGNVSRFLLTQRPPLDLFGIDLAPRMVELARRAVPEAEFAVHDCRNLRELNRTFEAIICAFGLPYLSPEEAALFIKAAHGCLETGGILYLSVMLGASEASGFQRCSTGDEVYVTYYTESKLIGFLEAPGFALINKFLLPSPSAAGKKTTDLIVIAKKV